MRSGSGNASVDERDFEAARAAAREAEENYSRAGNAKGALVARRTEMSLRGDEAMVSIAPLLRKRQANFGSGAVWDPGERSILWKQGAWY